MACSRRHRAGQGRAAPGERPGVLQGRRPRVAERVPVAGPARPLPLAGELLAAAPGLDRGRGVGRGLGRGPGRVRPQAPGEGG